MHAWRFDIIQFNDKIDEKVDWLRKARVRRGLFSTHRLRCPGSGPTDR